MEQKKIYLGKRRFIQEGIAMADVFFIWQAAMKMPRRFYVKIAAIIKRPISIFNLWKNILRVIFVRRSILQIKLTPIC